MFVTGEAGIGKTTVVEAFAAAVADRPAGRLEFLFTMPSAVAVINSLLGGVTVAVAIVSLLGVPLPVAVLAGMASGTAILALHVAYQVRRFATIRAGVAAEFPSARRPRLVH